MDFDAGILFDGTLHLTWAPPASEGTYPVDSYHLRSTAGLDVLLDAGTLAYDTTEPAAETADFYLSAVSAAGVGPEVELAGLIAGPLGPPSAVPGFTAAPGSDPGDGPNLSIADFDGDGVNDLVVKTNTGIYFLKGHGDGTFDVPLNSISSTFSCSSDSDPLYAVDLDGDGRLDLVGCDELALGRGDGTFTELPNLGLEQGYTYSVGDLNEDGCVDVVQKSSAWQFPATLTAHFSQCDGGFAPTVLATGNISNNTGRLGEPVIADYDNDGHLDIAVNDPDAILWGFGDGGFTPEQLLPSPSGYYGGHYPAAGDFNANGLIDFWDGQSGALLVNQGGRSFLFDSSANYLFGLRLVADFNGDGRADPGRQWSVALNLGGGLWPRYDFDGNTHAIAAGDLNGDGKADLVYQRRSAGNNLFVRFGR